MRVAIHQPNYAPWLGYFHKMAHADLFVFLDDVQFSKGSFINRVRIMPGGKTAWLTVPVKQVLGTPINEVAVARADWTRAHVDTLRNGYRHAAHFRDVWEDVEALYGGLPSGDLAQSNLMLIARLAARLGIATSTRLASSLDVGAATGTGRLVRIVSMLAPGGIYLSGAGGAGYQQVSEFEEAGLTLIYNRFSHPAYDQGSAAFEPGLSVLDAVFHLGWEKTSALVVG